MTKQRRTKQLADALRNYIEKVRLELAYSYIRDGEVIQVNHVADTGVWIGEEIPDHNSNSADVVMHFDGAGYDFFSHAGECCYAGIWKFRKLIYDIGQKHGFYVECLNTWSIGFYYEGGE